MSSTPFSTEDHSSLTACASCHKQDCHLKVCGRCKRDKYCSAECQKKDWKQHKASCISNKKTEDHTNAQGIFTQSYDCYHHWLDKVQESDVPFQLALKAGATKRMLMEQPSKNLIVCSIEFDFNARTFLPNKDPILLPVKNLASETLLSNFRETYRQAMPGCKHVVMFQLESQAVNDMILCSAHKDTILRMTLWDEVGLFSRLSTQFDITSFPFISNQIQTWRQMCERNLQQQLRAMAAVTPDFDMFLSNALLVGMSPPTGGETTSSNTTTTTTLLETHVVICQIRLGHKIADFQQLVTFDVRPIRKVADEMNDSFLIFFRQARQMDKIMIIFQDKRKWTSFPLMHQFAPGIAACGNNNSSKECKNVANAAFERLCRSVVFPVVQSPSFLVG